MLRSVVVPGDGKSNFGCAESLTELALEAWLEGGARKHERLTLRDVEIKKRTVGYDYSMSGLTRRVAHLSSNWNASTP